VGGENFRTRPHRTCDPPGPQWVPDLSPRVKRPRCGVNHPPHLGSRLKKE